MKKTLKERVTELEKRMTALDGQAQSQKNNWSNVKATINLEDSFIHINAPEMIHKQRT